MQVLFSIIYHARIQQKRHRAGHQKSLRHHQKDRKDGGRGRLLRRYRTTDQCSDRAFEKREQQAPGESHQMLRSQETALQECQRSGRIRQRTCQSARCLQEEIRFYL